MNSVNVRSLSRDTRKVVKELAKTGQPMLVTSKGAPVAALIGLDSEVLQDFILLGTREILGSIEVAQRNLKAGRSRPATTVLSELTGKQTAQPAAKRVQRAASSKSRSASKSRSVASRKTTARQRTTRPTSASP